MFLSWIIGFGQKAKVLHPQSVIDSCKEMCREALAQY
jgi:predicted DNA-binding transcriptional regulator YafY